MTPAESQSAGGRLPPGGGAATGRGARPEAAGGRGWPNKWLRREAAGPVRRGGGGAIQAAAARSNVCRGLPGGQVARGSRHGGSWAQPFALHSTAGACRSDLRLCFVPQRAFHATPVAAKKGDISAAELSSILTEKMGASSDDVSIDEVRDHGSCAAALAAAAHRIRGGSRTGVRTGRRKQGAAAVTSSVAARLSSGSGCCPGANRFQGLGAAVIPCGRR